MENEQKWGHVVSKKILMQKKNGSTLRLVKVQSSTWTSVWWNGLEIIVYFFLSHINMISIPIWSNSKDVVLTLSLI